MKNAANPRKAVSPGPGWRFFLCLAGVLLLTTSAAVANFTLGQRVARSQSILAGSSALQDWGWRGDIPYRRRLTFSNDISASLPQGRTVDEVRGSYDPKTGAIVLKETPLRTMETMWDIRLMASTDGVPSYVDMACLHEYGHALISDWCVRRRGTLGGCLEFALLTEMGGEPWQRLLLPAELQTPWDEWQDRPAPENAYGEVATGNFGEYLAESFARYLCEGTTAPSVRPATRAFFDSLGGKGPVLAGG